MQEKRGPRIGDAASLWNFTPAPGWTRGEAHLLKLCLMKYGVGQWQQIHSLGLLPGKLIQQLSGQTQRLLGQQSLAAFTGLQVDVDRIRSDNERREDVQRKGGLIIYGGPPPSRELKEQWRREAKEKYGLTPEQVKEVEEQLAEETRQQLEQGGRQEMAGHQGAQELGACDIMTDAPESLSRELKLGVLRRLGVRLAWALERFKRSVGKEAADAPHDAHGAADGAAEPSGWEPRAGPGAWASTHIEPGAVPQRNVWLGNSSRRQKGEGARGVVKKAAGSKQRRKPAASRSRSRSRSYHSSSDSDMEPGDGGDAPYGDEPGGAWAGGGRPPKVPRRARTVAQEAQDAALEADLGTLLDMGFSRGKGREALKMCGGDVQAACEWLFANCS